MREYGVRREISMQRRCLQPIIDAIWYGDSPSARASGWYSANADYLHIECFRVNVQLKRIVWSALERVKNE